MEHSMITITTQTEGSEIILESRVTTDNACITIKSDNEDGVNVISFITMNRIDAVHLLSSMIEVINTSLKIQSNNPKNK